MKIERLPIPQGTMFFEPKALVGEYASGIVVDPEGFVSHLVYTKKAGRVRVVEHPGPRHAARAGLKSIGAVTVAVQSDRNLSDDADPSIRTWAFPHGMPSAGTENIFFPRLHRDREEADRNSAGVTVQTQAGQEYLLVPTSCSLCLVNPKKISLGDFLTRWFENEGMKPPILPTRAALQERVAGEILAGIHDNSLANQLEDTASRFHQYQLFETLSRRLQAELIQYHKEIAGPLASPNHRKPAEGRSL